jgi:hypothetical protein
MGAVKNLIIREHEQRRVVKVNEHNENFELDDAQRFAIIISKKRKEWLGTHSFEHRLRCALLDLKSSGVALVPKAHKWEKMSSTMLQKNLAGLKWITVDAEFNNCAPLRNTVLLNFGISKGKRTKIKKYEKRRKEFKAQIAITMHRYSIECSFSEQSDRAWLSI